MRTAAAVFLLALFYLLTRHSYILFHSFAEIFSIVVAWSIFVLAFNTRQFTKTSYFMVLGTGFLFVGMCTLFHALAYKGMEIFPGSNDGNLGTQFWIASRYFIGLSFFIASLFLRKKSRMLPFFTGFLIVAALLTLTILWRPVFPVCFIPGTGLTPFKKISEYTVGAVLIASLWLVNKFRQEFHTEVYRPLCWSIVLMTASGLIFTFYKNTSGLVNALGHILEVLAFLMAYKAIIEKGLVHPNALIFYDLKRHEAALRAGKNEFRALFEFSGVGLAQIDPATGRFARINKKFCEITGYPPRELIKTICKNIIFPEDADTADLKEKICDLASGHTEQKNYVHKNGSIIRVEETCTTIDDVNGCPLYILIAVQDITRRVKAETALQKSEARLQSALLAGKAFIFEWHPASDEICRSENCGTILGPDPESCARDTSLNFFQQIHSEDRAGYIKLLYKLIPAVPDYKTEYRYVRADGRIVWLEERGQAVFDEKDNLVRLHGITADITDRAEARRRETEAVAAASAARSAINTVDAMGEGVVLLQLDGTIMNVNPAALAMTGFQLQDVLGKNIKDLLPQVLTGPYLDHVEKALISIAQKKLPYLQTVMLRRAQNPAVYVSPSVVFIESRQGLPATAVVTLKDITALHEKTKILERVFDNSHISIVYLDPQFNFVWVNKIYADACEKPVDFFPGKNHFDLYPHEENARIFRQVVASGEPYIVYEKPFEFPDQPERGVTYWDWSLQPVKDEQGQVEALLFCLKDTTARKIAQTALEQSERKYRELVENANSIIMRITPEHRIIFFNEYAQAFFGYSAEEVIGKNVLETIVSPIDSAGNDLRKMTEAITANPEIYSTNENENVCKNGRRVWISWTNKVIRDEQGTAIEILCIGTDATARKRIQNENQHYQKCLRRLAEQLAATEEQERWQISRYIHDTVIQNLSLSSMKLGALQQPQTDAEQQAVILQTTRQLIDEAIAECRNVMSELTPPLLYELGLTSALIEFASSVRERHGIPVTIDKTGGLDYMDNTLRGLLFQSARELVMNALKHAECRSICISIMQSGSEVQICVQDDGRGFDPALVFTHREAGQQGGFGLFSVRERVENLGGRLEIKSGQERGTEIRIFMPLVNN